jgi:hypothetical protein
MTLVLNAMMAGLLLATIIYCLKLNARIKVLQDSKSELARIIREFDESTQRATQSISEIHAATTRISENIQHKIDRANYLADDLQYMIEKGNKITGKVDAAPVRPIRNEPGAPRTLADVIPARELEAAVKDTVSEEAAAPRRALRTRSRAEQELISMLGGKKVSGE